MTADAYEGTNVAGLRAMLQARGLPTAGRRAELIDRLGSPVAVARCSRNARRPPRRPVAELGEDTRFADLDRAELERRLKFAAPDLHARQIRSMTSAAIVDQLRASVVRSSVGRHTRGHRRRGNTGG